MEFTGLRTNNPLLSGFEQDVEKAHVKSYTRTAKSGKMSMVKEHDDKRSKQRTLKDVKQDIETEKEILEHMKHGYKYYTKDYIKEFPRRTELAKREAEKFKSDVVKTKNKLKKYEREFVKLSLKKK